MSQTRLHKLCSLPLLLLGLAGGSCPPSTNDFLGAVSQNQFGNVVDMILQGADIRALDEDGNSALILAIKFAPLKGSGKEPGADLLCRLANVPGAPVDLPGKDGQAPVLLAFEKGMGKAVRCLSDAKASLDPLIGKIDAQKNPGETTLLAAIRIGADATPPDANTPCAVASTKRDLDTEDRVTGSVPLALAREKGGAMANVLICLANNGASMLERSIEGEEPLVWLLKKHAQKVEEGLKGDANKKFWANLAIAFMKAGGAKSHETIEGLSMLNWAIEKDHDGIALAFMENGVDPDWAGTKDKVQAPVLAAMFAGKLELLEALIKNPDTYLTARSPEDNRTLLHVVALRNDLKTASLLLDSGRVNLNAPDKDDRTPLHLANLKQNRKMIALLTQAGASDSMVDDSGAKPSELFGYDWLKWDIKKKESCAAIFGRVPGFTSEYSQLSAAKSDSATAKRNKLVEKTAKAIFLKVHPDKCTDSAVANEFPNCNEENNLRLIEATDCRALLLSKK